MKKTHLQQSLFLMRRVALGLGLTVLGSAVASANADIEAGKTVSQTCAACHGMDGNSTLAMFPSIAGQSASYLAEQLHAFRDGKRVNAIMGPQAKNLTDQQIEDVTAYFAAQTRTVKASASEDSIPGAHMWKFGGHGNTIAACAACHGTHGQGNQPAGFPALRGLTPQYIIESLMSYHNDQRKTAHADIMVRIASKLSDDDMKDIAQHIATFH
ncbi:cytochrome c4 [Halothiobacillus sp.]|jgi:cytochrome c553|uniref:c-type cytochrome n=1 Tax=Halothiobacillus sp. TaxID=1891311 RepID=UPI002AD44603|nr:cytochrome c4 [Halothiobacillus sp.]